MVVREAAERALGVIGQALEKRGVLLWWVVPRVYAREGGALSALLALWFVLGRLAFRFCPPGRVASGGFVIVVAAVPAVFLSTRVFALWGMDWAEGFLPDPVLGVVSAPVMVSVSLAFACVLVAIGTRRRSNSHPAPVEVPRAL